jgi:hypothetical protein
MVDKSYIPDGWKKGHVLNKGGKLSEEHRKKLSDAHKGKGVGIKNSVFGKQSITNGKINRMVEKNLSLEKGWRKGRTYMNTNKEE